ncbi:uncharacterized protein LOC122261411 isoform X2 [Penaeus japonicus]|uniref:uncharacterized protein LOC122261411 isoform X2 n=1 Tax=Penaeus japonicus TaxID=27405 RepID=UPI001C716D33|nr:uncharacterized protein LOC122261411 isoform X2 [Penaeus japonicus]
MVTASYLYVESWLKIKSGIFNILVMVEETGKEKGSGVKAEFKTNAFHWGHGNKYWDNVKVHPESGCRMTDTNTLHEANNPCLKEYNLSMKCLYEKVMHKEACGPYFDNYRICKTFWVRVIRDRRRKGISPVVPPVSEREKIKQEYIGTKGFEL